MRMDHPNKSGDDRVEGIVGKLFFNSTQNVLFCDAAGIAVALADYFFLIWINSFKKKT